MAEYLPDLQALLTHTNVVLAARNLKLSVPKCIGLVLGLQAGAPVGECSLSLGSAPLASASNKQKFKVRQPQRAAKSKRPNAPSDGSKNNGIHTTKQEEYPSRHLLREHAILA